LSVPEPSDLIARYDFSQEDGSLPVIDRTGNGNDLNTGNFSGVSSQINGRQSGLFDGVDDFLTTQFNNIQTQPNHIFISFELIDPDPGSLNNIFDGFSEDVQTLFLDGSFFDNQYNMFAGSSIARPASVTPDPGDIIIASCLFNQSNSILRLNKKQRDSGDVSGRDLDGITLGTIGQQNLSRFTNLKIGEVLIYPEDKAGIVSDVESYLSSRWGATTAL
jgi:hypothetical protein